MAFQKYIIIMQIVQHPVKRKAHRYNIPNKTMRKRSHENNHQIKEIRVSVVNKGES